MSSESRVTVSDFHFEKLFAEFLIIELSAKEEWLDAALPPRRVAERERRVGAATRYWTAIQTIYNLTIRTIHTCYVLVGETPLLVHNQGPCDNGALYHLVRGLVSNLKLTPRRDSLYPVATLRLPPILTRWGLTGEWGWKLTPSSIPDNLEVVPVGKSGHYELAVTACIDFVPEEFQAELAVVQPVG
jgi:hypothetical protein